MKKRENIQNQIFQLANCEIFIYGIESEEDEERNGRHASAFPLFQRDGAVVVVVNFSHHLLQDLLRTNQLVIVNCVCHQSNSNIKELYRFQLGCVPAEVFRHGHHLIDDAIHFLLSN